MEEEELARRINELEELEALEEQDFGQVMNAAPPYHAEARASLRSSSNTQQTRFVSYQRNRRPSSWINWFLPPLHSSIWQCPLLQAQFTLH